MVHSVDCGTSRMPRLRNFNLGDIGGASIDDRCMAYVDKTVSSMVPTNGSAIGLIFGLMLMFILMLIFIFIFIFILMLMFIFMLILLLLSMEGAIVMIIAMDDRGMGHRVDACASMICIIDAYRWAISFGGTIANDARNGAWIA